MKHMRRLSLLCVVFLTTFACTMPLKEQKLSTPGAEIDILIAGDASVYKDSLRQAIVKHYRNKANIRVVNINTLDDLSAEDYQAILIIDTCLAWTRFNPTVLAFLDNPATKGRVVWFMTVDDTETLYHHGGVDAITAASVVENQQRVAGQLIQKIDALISTNR